LTKEMLAAEIAALSRTNCLAMSLNAIEVAKPNATAEICAVIELLAAANGGMR
jgi:UDP-N-acetylglucosamine:LPS N-acetylglucosamine transferase